MLPEFTVFVSLCLVSPDPYRWPGNAPVGDACGFAGGTPFPTPAPEEGRYFATKFAQHGMRGSQLPRLPTGVVWTRGGEAEVTWQVKFNHGGGKSCLSPRQCAIVDG